MNRRDLQQLQKEETLKAELQSAKILREISDGRCPDFSVESLFPELKATLKGKAHTNLLADQPISLQLPFYEVVILPVEPIRTPECYKEVYGITFEETMELVDQGLVAPVLERNYAGYYNVKGHYMDPLLEMQPPTFARLELVDPILVALKGLASADELLDITQLKERTKQILTALGKQGVTKAKKSNPDGGNPDTVRVDLQAKGLFSGSIPLSRHYAELSLRATMMLLIS